jgi:hypothetical protein
MTYTGTSCWGPICYFGLGLIHCSAPKTRQKVERAPLIPRAKDPVFLSFRGWGIFDWRISTGLRRIGYVHLPLNPSDYYPICIDLRRTWRLRCVDVSFRGVATVSVDEFAPAAIRAEAV